MRTKVLSIVALFVALMLLPAISSALKIKDVKGEYNGRDIDVTGKNVGSIAVGSNITIKIKTDKKFKKAEIKFQHLPNSFNLDKKNDDESVKFNLGPFNDPGERNFTVKVFKDKKDKKADDTFDGRFYVAGNQSMPKPPKPPVPTPVPSGEKEKPRLHNFGPNKSTIKVGETVEISYTVSDAGGSGLRQVELWRGKDKGNLGHYKTDLVKGNGPVSGKFTDSPSPAGTYYYGIHVLDNKDNLTYDNGAVQVSVISDSKSLPPTDKEKPRVDSFNLNKSSMTVGDTVTISYTVSDVGSGLKQVELWRSPNNKDWAEVPNKRQSLSGNTKASGSFSDTPSSAGTYYYGMHVVDNAGNWDEENGPKRVTIEQGKVQKYGSVSGKVRKNSKNGALLSGVLVSCAGKNVTTRGDGSFKLDGIPAGNQDVLFFKSGYEGYKKNIEVKTGQNLNMGDDRWLVEKAAPPIDSLKPWQQEVLNRLLPLENQMYFKPGGNKCVNGKGDTWCYAFAREILNVNKKYNSAIDAFNNLPGVIKASNFKAIPIGAMVFWDANIHNARLGHAAIKINDLYVMGQGSRGLNNGKECQVTKDNYTNIPGKLIGYYALYIDTINNTNDNNFSNKPNLNDKAYKESAIRFSTGHCTWFAWGRTLEVTGKRLNVKGNAKNWWVLANNKGNIPRKNAIAVWYTNDEYNINPYGHVAFVEEVLSDGRVKISEANYDNFTSNVPGGGYDGDKLPLAQNAMMTHLKNGKFLGYIYTE